MTGIINGLYEMTETTELITAIANILTEITESVFFSYFSNDWND